MDKNFLRYLTRGSNRINTQYNRPGTVMSVDSHLLEELCDILPELYAGLNAPRSQRKELRKKYKHLFKETGA